MVNVLYHRGPDDCGVWTQGNVGLGQSRLSIIDLSPLAHQPMSNEDCTVWLAFNGEIYNFVELRERLVKQGHIFRSRMDGETIIHLWEEEGEQCVEKLNGMFALAIWDARRQVLFLARDREGEKPLFYAHLPDRFLFGSEIKSILQDPSFTPEPDLEAIHHYLAYQSVPAPYSAFQGIRKLPPASTLSIKNGAIQLHRYWKLSYRNKLAVNGPSDEQALRHEIVERLRQAVRSRLVSDVPLGAFLSGGIDSSIIVALMAGMMDRPVKTFSIGFTHAEYNELPYARMVAERYGTDHHELVVTPDVAAIIPEMVWHYDEPFADLSAIPTFYLCQQARQHVTVALSGDGGDENFAGYARYQNPGIVEIRRGLRTLLSRVTRPDKMLQAVMAAGGWRSNLPRFKDLHQRRLQYYYRISYFNEVYQSQLYTPDFRQRLGGVRSMDWMMNKFQESDAQDFLDAMMDVDLSCYLPDTLMTKMDIAAMAHSLEVRAPMLDHSFLEFAARIPSRLKLKDGSESKHILKQAFAPYLPHDVIHRKKMGFGVPLDHWFRNELKAMVYDTLLSQRAIDRGYFQRPFIQSLLDRHQAGENWHFLIWNLLMLELWFLMFVDRVLPIPAAHAPVSVSAEMPVNAFVVV